jgi:tetratricopeptide (TPR) repeat protein
MGRISFAQGKLNESRDYLMRSTQGAPTVKATWSLLGAVEQRLGHSGPAEEALAKAATLPEQPDWPDPFLREANRYRTGKVVAGNFAEELLRTGRAAEAVPLMERTVQTYPDFAKGWLMLGKALNQQSNYVRAEEALQKAVRLEPESVDARVELGSAFFAQNKFAEAEGSYAEAIRRKPNLAEAWFNLGLARMNQQSPDTAIEAFQNATKYKPDLTYAYIRWGQALGRLNRPAEAIEQLNRALQLSPDNAEAREMRAILKQFQPTKQ